MPTNHTDVNQWNTVVKFNDGEAANAASVRSATEPLADRAFFLRKRVTGSESGEELPLPMIAAGTGVVNFTWDSPQMEWRQDSVASAGVIFFDLTTVIPKNCKITSIGALVKGAAGHGALPITMPQIKLYEKNSLTQGNATVLGTKVDDSANVGAYETVHAIVLSGLTEVVANNSGSRYYLTFEGEDGTNELIGLRLLGLYATVDPS